MHGGLREVRGGQGHSNNENAKLKTFQWYNYYPPPPSHADAATKLTAGIKTGTVQEAHKLLRQICVLHWGEILAKKIVSPPSLLLFIPEN